MDFTASAPSNILMREAIRAGRWNLIPTMRNAPIARDTLAAVLLNKG
ncbi:hypothetical protein [Streptomyces erythrochromogenes]